MTRTIDVRRLVRIATFLLCLVAATLVYFSFAPQFDVAADRLESIEQQQQSDLNMAVDLPHLRQTRERLSARYAHLFAQNPEAVFLRGLDADVARHGVALVSTIESRAPVKPGPGSEAELGSDRTRLSVQLRGSYRHLLAAIAELSLSAEIVRVETPTLHRDGDEVAATIPVTIFEPTTHAPVPRAL